MAKDPEFLILKPGVGWLPESELPNVLGAVVKNPLSPLANSYPEYPEAYMKQKPMKDEFDDFILRKEQLSSTSFEVEIRGLGKLRWARSSGQNIDLSSKKILIRRMKRHDEYWNKMTQEDVDFQQHVPFWVQEKHLLKRKNRVCLVVGVLMCQAVVVAASEDEEREMIARGDAPLGTIAQHAAPTSTIPATSDGAGDLTLQASRTAVRRTYFKAKGEGTRIFALEMKYVSPKLELTEDVPRSERKLGSGAEAELSCEKLSGEDWASIVNDEGSEASREDAV
ncbi:MAG: hypothetical protein Q9159_004486 [Coniocarpon cinnabarinum]